MISTQQPMRTQLLATLSLTWLTGVAYAAPPGVARPATTRLIEIWTGGLPAFGVFVPSEQPRRDADGNRLPPHYTIDGAERLGLDPLLNYLFLNLEGVYDAVAVDTLVAGLARVSAEERPTLLIHIPPIERDGEQTARARVHDALTRGADGIVLPHVCSPEEARVTVGFFQEAGAEVWSPSNPKGRIIAMLMIEDPGALEAAEAIA